MRDVLVGNCPILVCGTNSLNLKNFCSGILKKEFCKNSTQINCQCPYCLATGTENSCNQNFLWLKPDGWYDVKTIDLMLSKIVFKLSDGEHFYVVMESVDRMPKACSNRILKILEEPSPGYRFILTTQNQNSVIATIRSRCQIFELDQEDLSGGDSSPIAQFLLSGPGPDQAEEFFDLVDSLDLDQVLSQEIFESIFACAVKEFIELSSKPLPEKEIDRLKFLMVFLKACRIFQKMPVQPGSGKIFWKNFFVQLVL